MTLRYAHEVRSEAEYFSDIPEIKLPNEMLRIAEHILETKTADFDPAFLEDRYRTVLVEMLRSKQTELPRTISVPPPSPQNVVNLMDVLKRSLAAERPSSRTADLKPAPSKAVESKPSRTKNSNARGRKRG